MRQVVAAASVASVLLFGIACERASGDSGLKARVWRVGYNQTEPFLFRNAQGQADGFAYEVMTAAAARRGLRLEWVFVPDGAYKAFTDRRIDLFPRTVNLDDVQKPAHISQPWFESYYGFIEPRAAEPNPALGKGAAARGGDVERSGPPGRAATDQIAATTNRGTPQEPARRIATGPTPFLRDFGQKRLPGAAIAPSANWRQAVALLCRGEADAVLAELREVTTVLIDRPDECNGVHLRLKTLPGAVLPAGIGANAYAAVAADALREEISALSESGELASVHSKWYGEFPYGVTGIDAAVRASREQRQLRFSLICVVGMCVVAWVVALRMRALRRDAVRAASAKGMFMATISHELRTPMNGVLGMAELLRQTRLDADQRHMVDTISQSGESLLGLINDVLDLARLDAGKLTVGREAFDLRETLRRTLSVLEPLAQSKGIELKLEVHPELPKRLQGDPLRIRQVLLNLAGNAVKFTQTGSVLVDVRPGQRRDEVWFMVVDTGVGIRAEALATLFEPFVQADASTTRTFGGSGLGLAISKRLVEAMRGQIGIESEFGKGTRCWFHLPLEAAAEVEAAREIPPPRRPLRILLAEDNPVNQTVARRILERQGHHVHAVPNGRLALDALSSGGPWDLVLMDCQMPEMDGYAATRQIRQMEAALARHTPIVALTAHAMADDRAKCLEAGMDDYLPKPFRPEELDEVIGRLAMA